MKASIASVVVTLFACALFPGCASIISGRHADVSINSYPSNAHVVVRDNDGRQVASCNTPGTVSLKRNRRFFLPARYTATVEAPGYATTQVLISSTVNPWIVGNLVIGGIPGLIVDNATGAAWEPIQSHIHTDLAPLNTLDQDPSYSENNTNSLPPEPSDTPPQVATRAPASKPLK